MVFEIKWLKEIVGLKRHELTREWRKVFSAEHRNLLPHWILLEYSIMEVRLDGACDKCSGEEKCMHSCGGENLWEDDTGRLRLNWKIIIKMD